MSKEERERIERIALFLLAAKVNSGQPYSVSEEFHIKEAIRLARLLVVYIDALA